MTVMPMAIANAVPFVMAVFLLLTPSLLAAQAPSTVAGKPDGAVSEAPLDGETNEPVTKLLFGLNFGHKSGWMSAFVLSGAGE
jgi:hypothetical protein